MNDRIKIIHPNQGEKLFNLVKKNVCAYARISNEQRLSSFDNQIHEYTTQIMNNPDWEFKGIYSDNGVSGFSTNTRVGFLKMIRDCRTKNIDLIITKSISRFARNTVDTLKYIQELKSLGTEVYFEKENLYTFDTSSELLLSLMSSVAEEEVKQVSRNVKWRIEKSLLNGTPALGKVYGYDVKDIHNYIVNHEESKSVRLIFNWFIEHKSYTKIKQLLEENRILTPTGKTSWSFTTIKKILQNPVYIGDLHRRKQINIEGKKVKNENYQQFYIENHHEPILKDETFNQVKSIINEIEESTLTLRRKKETYPLTGLLFCGHCGSSHRRKVAYYKKEVSGVNYSCTTALKKSNGTISCTLNNIFEPLMLEAINDFVNTLVKGDILQTRLNKYITKKSNRSKTSLAYKSSHLIVTELEKSLDDLRQINTNSIIQERVHKKEFELTKARVTYYETKKLHEEQFNIDYFNYLLEDYSATRNLNLLDNEILRSLIHRIVVKDQENIYIVLTSDSMRGSKMITPITKLDSIKPIMTKTVYKQRKGKELLLRYKVVYYNEV